MLVFSSYTMNKCTNLLTLYDHSRIPFGYLSYGVSFYYHLLSTIQSVWCPDTMETSTLRLTNMS